MINLLAIEFTREIVVIIESIAGILNPFGLRLNYIFTGSVLDAEVGLA